MSSQETGATPTHPPAGNVFRRLGAAFRRFGATFRRLGAAGPVAVVLSFWPPLGGFVLLTTLNWFGPWLRDHGTEGLLLYFLFTVATVGVSFLPTFSCAILAGWAFGFAVGTPIAVAALTVASLVAYAIGRWIARDRVLEVVRERPQWNAVYQAMLVSDPLKTISVVTLLRIPPFSPFAIANFALAAARVRLVPYTLGTLIGVTPRTVLGAFAAAQLEQLRFKDVGDRWKVASIVATIVVCVVLGMMANRALKNVTATR